MDGDGHADVACGGDDCDDTDPHRFPGNTEVCAVETTAGGTLTRTDPAMGLDPAHDEDCDPSTYANAATHDGDHDAWTRRAATPTARAGGCAATTARTSHPWWASRARG
jgi:hypothetical protein